MEFSHFLRPLGTRLNSRTAPTPPISFASPGFGVTQDPVRRVKNNGGMGYLDFSGTDMGVSINGGTPNG